MDKDEAALSNSSAEDSPAHLTEEKTKKKPHKKRNLWSIKITVISLFLSAFISFISEMTASSSNIIVTVLLLMFLILASILSDGIGVAATSCDLTPFVSMASRKVYGAKTAIWLVKNNEKVANVCNDVIGDIFGIISGACSAAIVVKIVTILEPGWQRWLTIGISSVVAALTIGGKAFLKNIAISNSKEFVLFIARILALFNPEERKRKKKQNEKKKKYSNAVIDAKLDNGKSDSSKDNGKSDSSNKAENAGEKSDKSSCKAEIEAGAADNSVGRADNISVKISATKPQKYHSDKDVGWSHKKRKENKTTDVDNDTDKL